MQKSVLFLLFVSLTVIAFAQSAKSTQKMATESPKMEKTSAPSVSRGASNILSTMANLHQKSIQKLYLAFAIIEDDEDTDVFPSQSEQDSEF